jgi:hypothetical protein
MAFVPSTVSIRGNNLASSTSSQQLYMSNGFFVDRISRVVKANVNKWVSNIENPEKVINQSVSDMQVRCCTFLPRIHNNSIWSKRSIVIFLHY